MVNPPPPGNPDQGPPPPGYGPPPGYPPPGYGPPPPGYGPPPGYPPPGYGPPPPGYGPPPEVKPGIIALRPLSLIDIYNGAVGYIRANPMVTLGLSAIVVVITQIVSGLALYGLTSAIGQSVSGSRPPEISAGDITGWLIAVVGVAVVAALANVVLTGILTAVVGRAVFGSTVTISEAWEIARTRIGALLGLAALLFLITGLLCGSLAYVLLAAAGTAGGATTVAIGMLLVPALSVVLLYGYTVSAFAPTAIVLEKLPVFDAIRRSYALVRNSFWRVLGILLLTAVIVALISNAVAYPFNLIGLAASHGADAETGSALQELLGGIGGTIGQIIVLPFSAGVAVLLYTDRRIRAEAFDLVLRTGATGASYDAGPDSLWLTRPPQ